MRKAIVDRHAAWLNSLTMVVLASLFLFPALGLAHPGHMGGESGWVAGFLHPLTGLDHLLALLGVGIWSRYQQGAARWLIPASFAGAILFGGALAGLGVTMPGVELGIAASVLGLGLLVATAKKLQLPWALSLGALFAVFHGFAHISELAPASSALGYVVGFMLMSLAGMGAGAALGEGLRRARATDLLGRAVGLGIAAMGALFIAVQFGL